MKTSTFFFACALCCMAVGVLSGCAIVSGALYVGFNPVAAICGSVLTIKDGQDWNYLGDEEDGAQGNTTTWLVKPIGTMKKGVRFGVRPRTMYGMYTWRVDWRREDGNWHHVRFHNWGANPYEFTVNRKAIGACQVEVRVIYRPATIQPSSLGGTLIVGSEEPERDIITDQDVVHRYLIPITFLLRYCDLR